MAKPSKNAEHIKQLKSLALSAGNYGMLNAVNAAIHALRIEGRSPWRKVGKRHPGKKWVCKKVLVAHKLHGVITDKIPPIDWWSGWKNQRTHWQPWPEHPEAVK